MLTSSTFTSNAAIFGKVYFPRIIVPLSNVISAIAKFLVQLIMFLGFYFYYIATGNDQIAPKFETLIFIPLMILKNGILRSGIGNDSILNDNKI